MKHNKVTGVKKFGRRIAAIACVAAFGVAAAGCGSSGGAGNNNTPTPTTSQTHPTTAPATTAPQPGGAGF